MQHSQSMYQVLIRWMWHRSMQRNACVAFTRSSMAEQGVTKQATSRNFQIFHLSWDSLPQHSWTLHMFEDYTHTHAHTHMHTPHNLKSLLSSEWARLAIGCSPYIESMIVLKMHDDCTRKCYTTGLNADSTACPREWKTYQSVALVWSLYKI